MKKSKSSIRHNFLLNYVVILRKQSCYLVISRKKYPLISGKKTHLLLQKKPCDLEKTSTINLL